MPRQKLPPEEQRKLEDKIKEAVDSWTDAERAVGYQYLYAQGMNLQRAKEIKQHAGMIE